MPGQKDTTYRAHVILFKSRGLIARDATDRMPESSYLDMDGCYEREENAMSTRYGSTIINRDPALPGANYPFTSMPVALGYMRGLGNTPYRYAILADGSVWRRATTSQGAYTRIASASTLSGGVSTNLVLSLFNSSQTWLGIFDGKKMLKDAGTGTPQSFGILPPNVPVTAQQYAGLGGLINAYCKHSTPPLGSGAVTLTNATWRDTSIAWQLSTAVTSPGSQTVTLTYTGGGGLGILMVPGMTILVGWTAVPAETMEAVTLTGVTSSTGSGATVTATFNYTHAAGQSVIISFGSFTSTSATSALSGDHYLHVDPTLGFAQAPDGFVVIGPAPSPGGTGLTPLQKFSSVQAASAFNLRSLTGIPLYASTNGPFIISAVAFSIAASTTAYATSTPSSGPVDFSSYSPSDLIVAVLRIDSPANVSAVTIDIDVAGSNYQGSYYTRTLTPATYQGYLSNPLTTGPETALANEVFLDTLNSYGSGTGFGPGSSVGSDLWSRLLTGGTSASSNTNQIGSTPLATSGGSATDAVGAWSVIYLPLGSFLPVGSAGQGGNGWNNVTGHRITITTNSEGGTNVELNALYIQGGNSNAGASAPTLSGPSSWGGVGYDYRYTYYDISTGTESNPCPENVFSTTTYNPGAVSTLVVFRQAIQVQGQYSPDPQVTHVRIYRRGGLYGQNWFYLDQIANVTGTGTWTYKDILPDTVLQQSNVLALDNDPPVTSTIQNPISTTLSSGLTPATPASTANPNTPTLLTITVADSSAVFVPGQWIDIGTVSNFEQTRVVAGGTGTCTAYIQLPHVAGEPVYVFSIPNVACNLSEQAYDQLWLAGDPNNPHYLYYSKPGGYRETFPPQNYIPCGSPSNPIVSVVNIKGTLFVGTLGDTWYQIYPGSPPRAQITGSKHGPVALTGRVAQNESETWLATTDGIRVFRGVDGPLMTVLLDWLWTDNSLTPVPLVDTTRLSAIRIAYSGYTATVSYIGQDGNRHRLMYDSNYKRWRNDDVQVSAFCLETDTGTLVYSKYISNGGLTGWVGWAVVYDSPASGYDDGGWAGISARSLVQAPIPFRLQTPYFDLGAPNNQKQFNSLTLDVNPNGQTIYPVLLFDDNNGTVTPVTPSPASFTGSVRAKFEFSVNAGLGQQAYRISLQLSSGFSAGGAGVLAPPVLYQADLYAAVLADKRTTYDTYWIKMGTDESKLVKQAFLDYTSTGQVTVAVYADGGTTPYYTFTLPANPTRTGTPVRVRFPMKMLRQFRMVATAVAAGGSWQLWREAQLDWKPIAGGGNPSVKGYRRLDLGDVTP